MHPPRFHNPQALRWMAGAGQYVRRARGLTSSFRLILFAAPLSGCIPGRGGR